MKKFRGLNLTRVISATLVTNANRCVKHCVHREQYLVAWICVVAFFANRWEKKFAYEHKLDTCQLGWLALFQLSLQSLSHNTDRNLRSNKFSYTDNWSFWIWNRMDFPASVRVTTDIVQSRVNNTAHAPLQSKEEIPTWTTLTPEAFSSTGTMAPKIPHKAEYFDTDSHSTEIWCSKDVSCTRTKPRKVTIATRLDMQHEPTTWVRWYGTFQNCVDTYPHHTLRR